MTTKALPTFEVDKEGLRKLLARKGMAWILPELLQNTWDEEATTVSASLEWIEQPKGKNAGRVLIQVEDDDPDGFTNLAHAYTLFAESEKKSDSEKRGRFNIGEKLVIAACDTAEISTTTGVVSFNEAGRTVKKAVRKHGTLFSATTSMTKKEYDEALALAKMMIPPAGVTTTINGDELQHRMPIREFKETLSTPIGENLRPSARKTTVSLYEVEGDEKAYLYEMGIPVVALIEGGDRWHIDVCQKVPLNIDRDNVTPAYLRAVRTAVANNAFDLLDVEDARESWVTDAMTSKDATPTMLSTVLTHRFGDKVAAFSPRDQEANKIAASEGYTVVSGRSLPSEVWQNLRTHDLIQSTAVLTPAPKPYDPGQQNTRKIEPIEKWSDGMKHIQKFVIEVAERICNNAIVVVEIVNDADCTNFLATYGRSPLSNTGKMEFNLRTLGRRWFEQEIDEEHISLVIHELGHHFESDHLSRGYYNALTDLGARLTLAAVADPEWWASIV